VAAGECWIEGHHGESIAAKTVSIGANASGNPRRDRIVLRLDSAADTISVEAVTGTPAASPVAPALTQTTAVWEESLATVLVASGSSSITAGNITDTRRFVLPDGRISCASTNRPPSPVVGQVIHESDTGAAVQWAGTAWLPVGFGAWTNITTLGAGITAQFSRTPRYRLEPGGLVRLRGAIGFDNTATRFTFGQNIATLPAGARPSVSMAVAVAGGSDVGLTAVARLTVTTTGNVLFESPATGPTVTNWVSLDNIVLAAS
jgi:hypothetical protein